MPENGITHPPKHCKLDETQYWKVCNILRLHERSDVILLDAFLIKWQDSQFKVTFVESECAFVTYLFIYLIHLFAILFHLFFVNFFIIHIFIMNFVLKLIKLLFYLYLYHSLQRWCSSLFLERTWFMNIGY